MTDLAISVRLNGDGTALVNGLRPVKAEIEGIKTSAKGASVETKAFGQAGRVAANDLGELERSTARGAASARGFGTSARAALADVIGLGSGSGAAAGEVAALAASSEGVAGALALIASPAGIAVAAVAAIAAGMVVAYNVADTYAEHIGGIEKALARAGQGSSVAADQIQVDANRIAAASGQAFEKVEAASLKLATSGQYTRDSINDIATAGAFVASTFGTDVLVETQNVSTAFDKLGNGDAKALASNFEFLDAATREMIVQLALTGKTAEAQTLLMQELAKATHGEPGSVSSAFGEAKSAFGDWFSAMLAQDASYRTIKGWLNDLAQTARNAAAEIRAAVNAKPGAELGNGQLDQQISSLRSGQNEGSGAERALIRARIKELEAERYRRADQADAALSKGINFGKGGFPSLSEFLHPAPTITVTGRRPSGGGSAASGSGNKGVSQEAREAARAARELATDLKALEREYDPVTASANKLADTLAKIAALKKAGKLSNTKAQDYASAARIAAYDDQIRNVADSLQRNVAERAPDIAQELGAALDGELTGVADHTTGLLSDGMHIAAEKFRNDGIDAAKAISDVLGGRMGSLFNALFGEQSPLSQLFKDSSLGSGLKSGIDSFGNGKGDLKKTFKDIFSGDGDFAKSIGSVLGNAVASAQFGKSITNALGVKGSKTGAAIGGTIGAATRLPFAKEIGAVLGSVVGGAFKSAKKGSAAIQFTDGALTVGSAAGNSASFKKAATGLAGNVVSGLENVAEQLGGIVAGKVAVSIGVRNGKPVVDTTGQNRTKGAGVVKFAKGDEAGATAFALADALSDGVITGLSTKVSEALKSSSDIDKALREALKVDDIEQLLDGFGGSAKKAFVDFERQAKERLRIGGKYGFDLVKLEAENAKQRNKLFEQTIEQATGGLKSLLEDLLTGERAAGTLSDRRAALIVQAETLKSQAATDADAAAKLADVLDQIERVSLDANGTAGAQYASDRNFVKSTAQLIIDQATADIKAAQDKARANAGTDASTTDALLASGNQTLEGFANDAYAQGQQIIAALKDLKFTGSGVTYDPAALARAIGGGIL